MKSKLQHRIRDVNFLRQRWSKFLSEWQDMNKPMLYFVKADIKNAYPSVSISKLKEILENTAKELGFISQKSFRVITQSRIFYKPTAICWNMPDIWNASIHSRPCFVQIADKQVQTKILTLVKVD